MTSTSEMERPHQPVIWPPGGMLSDWQARADLSQFFPYGSLGWLEFPFFLLPLCLDWVLYSTSANSMVFPPPSSFQNSASRLGSNLGLCSSTHRRCPLFLSGWFSARCIVYLLPILFASLLSVCLPPGLEVGLSELELCCSLTRLYRHIDGVICNVQSES